MNIQQLEYILAVDQYRHFAKAAEHCRVTQPTLSMMIQKLEDELGVKIFDRALQPIRPTPAGKKIIEQARVVLHQAALIKDIVNEEEQSLKGTFHLAVLPTIAPYLLPRFFPAMMEKKEELDIRVMEMKTAQAIKALMDGDIDAAIIANEPVENQLRGEILFYERFFGYVAKNEPGPLFPRPAGPFLPDGEGPPSPGRLSAREPGDIHADGRERKRHDLHPRTGHSPVERAPAGVGPSFRHSGTDKGDRLGYPQGFRTPSDGPSRDRHHP